VLASRWHQRAGQQQPGDGPGDMGHRADGHSAPVRKEQRPRQISHVSKI